MYAANRWNAPSAAKQAEWDVAIGSKTERRITRLR